MICVNQGQTPQLLSGASVSFCVKCGQGKYPLHRAAVSLDGECLEECLAPRTPRRHGAGSHQSSPSSSERDRTYGALSHHSAACHSSAAFVSVHSNLHLRDLENRIIYIHYWTKYHINISVSDRNPQDIDHASNFTCGPSKEIISSWVVHKNKLVVLLLLI